MTKGYFDRKFIGKIKESFTPGTKIELIRMGKDIQRVPDGTRGIVDYVDDAGTIHMKWDSGSSLGLIVGEDLFKIINDKNDSNTGSE